jgi:hypothetical protein
MLSKHLGLLEINRERTQPFSSEFLSDYQVKG